MAWNPSPKVAAARDFGKKFGYDKVIIIGVNEAKETYEIVSYGETKKKCSEAQKTGEEIHEMIQNAEIVF